MQRRLTIRTNPPGALVYIDDYPIGTTPCSTDFVYYGTRKVRIVKSGYETLTVMQPIPTPWYQYPGLDFVCENLVPGEIRDERVVEYQLQPQTIVPSPQLLDRAENLRHGAVAPQRRFRPCRRPVPVMDRRRKPDPDCRLRLRPPSAANQVAAQIAHAALELERCFQTALAKGSASLILASAAFCCGPAQSYTGPQ